MFSRDTKVLTKATNIYRRFKSFENWHDFYLDYFLRSEGEEKIYRTRTGLKIKARARTTDRYILNEIFGHKVYDQYVQVGKGDTVVDIGGHIGSFALKNATIASNIHIYEPLSDNYELLQENIKLNSIDNIEAEKKAVSDSPGKATLSVSDVNTGGNRLEGSTEGISEKVEKITLEEVIRKAGGQIDFLKLDCEGSETEIILESEPETLEKISKIAMEIHAGSEGIAEKLEKNGFKVEKDRSVNGVTHAWRNEG